MGKIRWTEKSSGNLKAIYEYIANDSKTYATRFIKSLIRATEKLEKMPGCGRLVPELKNYDLREVIYRNYRIIYRIVVNDTPEILAVIHTARDITKSFREEWELMDE